MNRKLKNNDKRIYLFLGVAALVCFLAASGVLPFLTATGKGTPVPDVLLCFVCALPLFTDYKIGAIYALSLGFLSDLFINPPFLFSPVVLLLCMYLAGYVQGYFSRVGTLAVAVSTLPCVAVKLAVSLAVSLFTVEGIGFKTALSGLSYMSFITDFAAAIILSFIMRVVGRRLRITRK